jgi:hypothetical protein
MAEAAGVFTAAGVAAFMAAGTEASMAAASGAKADLLARITADRGRCIVDRGEGCLEGDRKVWAANRHPVARSVAPLMGALILRRDGTRWEALLRDDRHLDELHLDVLQQDKLHPDELRRDDPATWLAD